MFYSDDDGCHMMALKYTPYFYWTMLDIKSRAFHFTVKDRFSYNCQTTVKLTAGNNQLSL